MGIRFKLLVLLLVLSLVPLGVLRYFRGSALKELGKDTSRLTRTALIDKAREQLMAAVQDQARLVDQGTRLLSMALYSQADRVEHGIRGNTMPESPDEMAAPLAGALGGLTNWLIIALEDGRKWVYPGATVFPPRFDARHTKWYREAMESGHLVWIIPSLEPSTHQVVITGSIPVRDTAGRPVGVVAVMAPFSALLADSFRAQGLTPDIKAFLVDTTETEDSAQGLPIIGQYEASSQDSSPGSLSYGWCCPQGQRQVVADDPQLAHAVLQDLRQKKSSYRHAPYQGQDALWVYTPTNQWGAALVIVAPIDHIVKDADIVRQNIETGFAQQADTSLRFILAAMLFIAAAAFLAAGRVTRPIRDLSLATERIAQGELDTKVSPRGRDELASLGRAFNNMVSRLRDHVRLREAVTLAEKVQKNLLPKHIPQERGFQIAARSRPSDEICGDYYDVIDGVHGRPDSLGVFLGDVSGHGLEAALLMTTARALLRQRVHQPGTPAETVMAVNRFLAQDTDGTGRFMTLFFIELDRTAGKMTWVRAGHDPALLFDRVTGSFEELAGPGIPLGVEGEWAFTQQTRPLPNSGQVLFIGSDGLWEARNEAGEMFGKERIRQIINDHASASAQFILDTLLAEQARYLGDAHPEDDVTLMIIKVA